MKNPSQKLMGELTKPLETTANNSWQIANIILARHHKIMMPDENLKTKTGLPKMTYNHLPEIKFLRSILEPDMMSHIGMFTYFLIEENIDRNALKEFVPRLREFVKNSWLQYLKDVHDKIPYFPEQIIDFGKSHIITKEIAETYNLRESMPNFEVLFDALVRIENIVSIKKIESEISGETKKLLSKQTKKQAEKIEALFDELSKNRLVGVPKGEDDNVRIFFKKIRAYKNIEEFIIALEHHIKNLTSNNGYMSVKKALLQYPDNIEIVYDGVISGDNEILMAKFNSYAMCREFGSSSWCIKREENYWNSYSSFQLNNNKKYPLQQFYQIYNFAGDAGKGKKIGLFVNPDKKISAAHDDADNSVRVENLSYYDSIKEFLLVKNAADILKSVSSTEDILEIVKFFPALWKEYINRVDTGKVAVNNYVLIAAINERDLDTFKKYINHPNVKPEEVIDTTINDGECELSFMITRTYKAEKDVNKQAALLEMFNTLHQHPNVIPNGRQNSVYSLLTVHCWPEALEILLNCSKRLNISCENLQSAYVYASAIIDKEFKVKTMYDETDSDSEKERKINIVIEKTKVILELIKDYVRWNNPSQSQKIITAFQKEYKKNFCETKIKKTTPTT